MKKGIRKKCKIIIQIENEKENAKGTDIENGKKRSCERDIVTENGRDTVEL